jgi:pimeloyl-ACP methyl ester carboxylesterase
MKHIYCISGFGADERVFENLDFGENEVHFISWKIPEKKEPLFSYAKRMSEDIIYPDPILIGLSFGGMMSIEIAKIISVQKVILISSISTFHELPLFMKIAGKLRLNKLIPMKPYPILEPLENYNLGVETKEEKKLLKEYRKNLNLQYSNWAMDQVVNWKNDWIPPHLVSIHGTKDHIFPIRYIQKPDYIIRGGGHLISMNNSEEVNKILKDEL